MGIPLFGNSWTLTTNETSPPVRVIGGSSPATHTNKYVILRYSEICLGIKNGVWNVTQDPNKAMGPYAFSTDKSIDKRIWVGFGDPAKAVIKSEYILTKGLGGAAVTDISYDDFRNKCGGGISPVLSAIGLRTTLIPEASPMTFLSNSINEVISSSITVALNSCFFTFVIFLVFI